MRTSAQPSARILAALLSGHGIKNVVISPGSRNAPLVVAISRQPGLTPHVVIDERSAGFVALGMAIQSGKPVALICTSGTALLNYAPAVAEAYYRCIPLIVVSADRPARWIDQDDSQTIRQFEALANFVNISVDIVSDYESKDFVWHTNRLINDAIIAATAGRQGPVHINIQLDEPLGETTEVVSEDCETRIIRSIQPELTISTGPLRKLVKEYLTPPRRVLIVAGFMPPDQRMTRSINKLNDIPNIAVFYEAQSNLQHTHGGFGMIDRLLSSCSEETLESMKPDVVISIGGSLVSRKIKRWLRDSRDIIHWHIGIGPRNRSIDVFKILSMRFEVDPVIFMQGFASAVQPFKKYAGVSYKAQWARIYSETCCNEDDEKWSDLTAVKLLVRGLDKKTNLHVSNGTAVRYLQLCDYRHIHRIECNRGVSGIDGSTSTAVGSAMLYSGPTVLLTGDMSARYDIGALTLKNIPSRFSIIILNNGGGDIFRVIASTRHLEEREEYFACSSENISFKALAEATGFEYISAENKQALKDAVQLINRDRKKPLMLEIKTATSDNASILRRFLGNTNRLKL